MYNIDINFLKDRGLVENEPLVIPAAAGEQNLDKRPIYAGAGVGVFSLVAVGIWWVLQMQITNTNSIKLTKLEEEVKLLESQVGKLKTIEAETTSLKEQTTSLSTVFNYIRPWSAFLQDIRDRVPSGVQITLIEQKNPPKQPGTPKPATPAPAPAPAPAGNAPKSGASAPATPAPAPAPVEPPPTIMLEISGLARSFGDMNDFLLLIQESAFFEKKETKVVKAELIKNPTRINSSGGSNTNLELPKVVEYKIQTSLSNTPASELIAEIRRKGAVGVESRLEKIQEVIDNKNTKK